MSKGMKTALLAGLGVGVAALLLMGSLGLGWVVFAQGPWNWSPMSPFWGGDTGCWDGDQGTGQGYGPGMGMMGGTSWNYTGEMPCDSDEGWGTGATPPRGQGLDIEQARNAVERYLSARGYGNLRIREVMEFERNFYAIAEEPDTGIGAMELLVDRWTGLVGPEMGPNMMWNARYGMMGGRGMGMMGYRTGEMRVEPEEATEIAQRWLDANQAGAETEEHADAFYEYYTIHTVRDGEISGMLSVHGSTGQVWYHSWHGPFIRMIGEEDEH